MFLKNKLKLLSWNIYMLPSFLKPKGIEVRSEIIASHVRDSDFDIVVFQEAFNSKSRSIINLRLRELYPYQIGPINERSFDYRINSGLWILSKIPLKTLKSIEFSCCRGFDCVSRKGAIIAEGEFLDTRFQVLATHLDSGDNQNIRNKQYWEIETELLGPFRKEHVLQIICGDFNTNKTDPHYSTLLNMLNVNDYETYGNYTYSYDGKSNDMIRFFRHQNLIDYIFCRLNGKVITSIRRDIQKISKQWSRQHKDVSDHYAVVAEIIF